MDREIGPDTSYRARVSSSGWTTRAGQALTAVVALFLVFDAGIKLIQLPIVLDTTRDLGWPAGSVVPRGVILLVSTALYILPRTALLGGILLTAYLGGAVATHARIGSPMVTHTLFGAYVGMLLWLALLLRYPAVRSAFGLPTPPTGKVISPAH